MSKEAIIRIAGSEEEAEQIVQKAGQKAKALVSEAESNAKKKYETAVKSAYAKSAELCENAKNEASKQSAEFFSGVDRECEQLYSDTRGKIDEAVKLVVERVVKGL